MNPLIGKWQQPTGQPYPGLWFLFKEDGTFEAELASMGITSGGTYRVDGSIIHMDQARHTLGITGKFEGRFSVENDTLKMALGNPGEKAPAELNGARLYIKQ